jgi:hypothetical protein
MRVEARRVPVAVRSDWRDPATNAAAADRSQGQRWAERWIEVGFRTEPADRERFERSACELYERAGVDWPGVVVWVPSPTALALAAPAAALAIELSAPRPSRAVSVRSAVKAAIGDAMAPGRVPVEHGFVPAVRCKLPRAADHMRRRGSAGVWAAINEIVETRGDWFQTGNDGPEIGWQGSPREVEALVGAAVIPMASTILAAVRREVDDVIARAAHLAPGGETLLQVILAALTDIAPGVVGESATDAVAAALAGAPGNATPENSGRGFAPRVVVAGLGTMLRRTAPVDRFFGGQFAAAEAAWATAVLEYLEPPLASAVRSYGELAESGSWWWPHQRFVMACERPIQIHWEQGTRRRPGGWFEPWYDGRAPGATELHNESGPAIRWSDGSAVWATHGILAGP